jgi:D-ribose pyranase
VKKVGLINGQISSVISLMGHSDTLTIGDAGLPVPPNVPRIDLALKPGTPGFLETLEVVLKDLYVMKAYLSKEILDASPEMYAGIKALMPDIELVLVPHTEFKAMTASSKAVVRTAEYTHYSNIILAAGAWGFDR